MSQTLDLASMARILNLDIRRVQQLAKEGIIPKPDKRGEYQMLPCIMGYIKYLQESSRTGKTDDAMYKSKTRHSEAKARIAELTALEMEGSLIPADQVRNGWQNMASNFKARLRGIPSRIAPKLAGVKDPNETQNILKREIETALRELGDTEISAD